MGACGVDFFMVIPCVLRLDAALTGWWRLAVRCGQAGEALPRFVPPLIPGPGRVVQRYARLSGTTFCIGVPLAISTNRAYHTSSACRFSSMYSWRS